MCKECICVLYFGFLNENLRYLLKDLKFYYIIYVIFYTYKVQHVNNIAVGSKNLRYILIFRVVIFITFFYNIFHIG